MSVTFEVNIPDEPYKVKFTQGKKVKLTYIGPRFLVISVDSSSKQVYTHEGAAESIDEINLNDYNQENKEFYTIDSQKHPLIACFLTHQYENDEYEDYEEVLPTGETWTYLYENHILGNIYSNENPVYFPETDQFSSLQLLKPSIEKSVFAKGIENKINDLEKVLDDIEITETNKESIEHLKNYLEWLKNIDNNYPSIDHWKIPFPNEPRI